MTRHESREAAFIVIFEKMFQSDMTVEEIFTYGEEEAVLGVSDFAKELANRVFENLEEIDSVISENLVGWSVSRISKVSRAVLRLAVCELKYSDIPVGVAVNEAVEITKKYSGEQDSSFVNGVLASVAKKVRS